MLTKLPLERAPYVVFISSLNSANSLIFIINLILILIILLGIGVGIFTASKISANLSKPIINLGKLTDEIGRNEVKHIDEKSDVYELSNLYKSINGMSDRIESYDKAQKVFMQNASHELRTPLMSIQGYSEGISNGIITDVKHAADVIHSESIKLKNLVDELLTLSRIENMTYIDEIKEINICDYLKEYVQRLKGFAIKENKELVLNIPEVKVLLNINETLLSQVIMNVVSNCIKYAKYLVKVELTTLNNSILIKVSDDGNGIAENDLPHIFERFYKGKSGNFGLGLAIAKTSVEFMGGNISARNAETGAEFTIELKL